MKHPTPTEQCERIRERIHLGLDEQPSTIPTDREVTGHLAGCAGCKVWAAELVEIQRSLSALAPQELPEIALQRIWKQTSRRQRSPRTLGRGGLRAAMAAAIVFAVAFGIWSWRQPTGVSEPVPSQAELRTAAEEARVALRLAAGALRKTRRVTVEDVLTDEVSGTLRKVPMQWPEPSERAPGQRRSKT